MTNSKSILRKSIITVFSFLAIIFVANGQENQISQTPEGFYFYEGKAYQLQDLGAVIHDDSEAFILYMDGRNKYSSSKTLGIVAIAGIGVGALSFSLIHEPDDIVGQIILLGPNEMLTGLGIVFVGAGAITGIVALSRRSSGLSLMKKSVSKFNSKNNAIGYQPNLQLGLTNNGAGFVLTF